MPKNIEIKAVVQDVAAFRNKAEALSDGSALILHQVDTFFHVPKGRLKLRIEESGQGQLIFYMRPDETGPKTSQYEIYTTDNPDALAAVLSTTLGVRGVVRKTRQLYLVGQTRIHLDQVEDLGDFMELEVVLAAEQDESAGEAIANSLRARLGIDPDALVRGAYLELLEAGA